MHDGDCVCMKERKREEAEVGCFRPKVFREKKRKERRNEVKK